MDIPLNVDVSCAKGHFGRSTTIIINPVSNQVTHVVVKHKGTEYLVPLRYIVESTPNHIQLRCNQMQVAKLVPFERARFVSRSEEEDDPGGAPWSGIRLWPYRPLRGRSEQDDQLPHDQLCIDRGAHVRAIDGDVGRVDEFLIDPISSNITHLVLLEGSFWGRREVTIPISEIDRIEEDCVFLKLTRDAVRALPSAESGPRFWEYHPQYGDDASR